MKNITILGGIGKDAATRTTQGGDKVTGFSVGVSDGFGPAKRTIWFDVTIWGARGENLAPNLTKGSKICVTGDLSTREHDGKTYLTIRAHDVSFAGGGERRDIGGGYAKPATGGAPGQDFDDDTIPFQMEWR
jgi:single-strand DNA-binding protein